MFYYLKVTFVLLHIYPIWWVCLFVVGPSSKTPVLTTTYPRMTKSTAYRKEELLVLGHWDFIGWSHPYLVSVLHGSQMEIRVPHKDFDYLDIRIDCLDRGQLCRRGMLVLIVKLLLYFLHCRLRLLHLLRDSICWFLFDLIREGLLLDASRWLTATLMLWATTALLSYMRGTWRYCGCLPPHVATIALP